MRMSSAPIASGPEIERAYRRNDCLWERLKAARAEVWDEYLHNDFIWHLAEGKLTQAAYRHFIEQDYIYCVNYARAYALAAYKAENLTDMRRSLTTLSAVIDKELDLHLGHFKEWGLTLEQVDRIPESNANVAYTRYILDCGLAGDVLDLHTALSPCVIGYAEVGKLLIDHKRTKLNGNPFRGWIEYYAADDYQEGAQAARDHLDEAARGKLTLERFAQLADIFAQTVRLDIKFWQMGFALSD